MQMITAIAGAACLLYYAGMAVYAGWDVNFGWFWIGLGAAFLLVSFSGRSRSRWIVLGGKILLTLLIIGLLLLLFQSIRVFSGMRQETEAEPKYAITLGAEVKGTVPSRSLRMRLDKAEEFAREHPGTVLILSGGKGSGEDISEAQCMYNYLTEHGIPGERLILEDRSTSTRENLIFSDELTGCAVQPCGIISNGFHICRALQIARSLGYTDPAGIPAKSDPFMLPHLVVREAAALTVGKITGSF